MKKPVVAIVGKPNVGKSTIFNRLVGTKISIIEDTPGVTRDRVYGSVTYNDYNFHLIDTGGIEMGTDSFQEEINVQVDLAIDEADIIIFVVDGKEGLTPTDKLVGRKLIKVNKPVILAINKVDSKFYKDHEYDFYELGIEKIIKVSGEQNIGIYELLEEITSNITPYTENINDDVLRFCIIGRPNVGKSSLVNAILNEERSIVSNIAGTTRDSIDTPFTYHGRQMTVIDTAGMRKKGKIYENVEKYSLIRSLKAIDRSNVCLIVINAQEGIIEHDKHIAGYALEAGKAVVIVVNKWDTVTDDKDMAMKKFKELVRSEFAFMPYAPIVFLSALTKKRIHTLIPEIIKVYENSKKEIKTNLLNDCINEAYLLNLPPSYKGKRLKIYFSNQVSSEPPTFNIQVNNKGLVHFSYERYIENKIRESFDFEGTPIVIHFKNKGEQEI